MRTSGCSFLRWPPLGLHCVIDPAAGNQVTIDTSTFVGLNDEQLVERLH